MKYYKLVEDYPGNALEIGSVFSSNINYYDKFPLLFAEITQEEYDKGKLILKYEVSLKTY